MRAFAWMVKSEAEPMMASGTGLSSEYILPSSLVGDGRQLAGGVVYIIERGSKADLLFARMCISRVEEIVEDELGEKQCLLSVDSIRSARFIKSYSDDASLDFVCAFLKALPYGFSELSPVQVKSIEDVVSGCIQNNFRPTPSTVLSRIVTPEGHGSKKGLAQFVLREVVRTCAMTEIWGGLKARDPFVNTALFYAKSRGLDVAAEILALDSERADIKVATNIVKKERNASTQILDVDLNFVPIDEDHIVVRRFVAADESLSLIDAMAKTESAEKRHQTILRDVVIRLKSLGIKPFQTSSCDLVIFENGAVRLFEIKSMTESNMGTQTAKGLFQLILYARALMKAGYKVSEMAIIGERTSLGTVLETIVDALASVNVGFYSFDATTDWPARTSPVLSVAPPMLATIGKGC